MHFTWAAHFRKFDGTSRRSQRGGNRAMAVIAGRNVGTNDLVVMGAGVVMFIDSFLPWWGFNVKGFGGGSVSGWHFFLAWLSILLGIAVVGVAAARIFGGRSLPPIAGGAVSTTFITAAVSSLVFIILVIRWLTY